MLPPIAADVEPGALSRKAISVEDPDSGQAVAVPAIVGRGTEDGPALCLVSGQIGTAINGAAAIHLFFRHLGLDEVKGSVIGIPLANPSATRVRQEYFPGRTGATTSPSHDLSQVWPGDPDGNLAERTAAAIWESCIEFCHAAIDFHAQAVQYGPKTTVRATSDASIATAKAFGIAHIQLTRQKEAPRLHDVAARQGKAALEAYLPPGRLVHPPSVRLAINGIRNAMAHLRMLSRGARSAETALIIPEAETHVWTAPTDGIVLAHVDPGSIIQEGKLVAELISLRDFGVAGEAIAPFRGVVTMIGCPSQAAGSLDHDVASRGEPFAAMARCDV